MILRKNFDNLTARFPAGTLERIDAALRGRENKADFIRSAVEEKLTRREYAGKKRGTATDEADGAPVG